MLKRILSLTLLLACCTPVCGMKPLFHVSHNEDQNKIYAWVRIEGMVNWMDMVTKDLATQQYSDVIAFGHEKPFDNSFSVLKSKIVMFEEERARCKNVQKKKCMMGTLQKNAE